MYYYTIAVCTQACENGGTLNTSTCRCDCVDGYNGASYIYISVWMYVNCWGVYRNILLYMHIYVHEFMEGLCFVILKFNIARNVYHDYMHICTGNSSKSSNIAHLLIILSSWPCLDVDILRMQSVQNHHSYIVIIENRREMLIQKYSIFTSLTAAWPGLG